MYFSSAAESPWSLQPLTGLEQDQHPDYSSSLWPGQQQQARTYPRKHDRNRNICWLSVGTFLVEFPVYHDTNTLVQWIFFLGCCCHLGVEPLRGQPAQYRTDDLEWNIDTHRPGINPCECVREHSSDSDCRIRKNGRTAKEVPSTDPCRHGCGDRALFACSDASMDNHDQTHRCKNFRYPQIVSPPILRTYFGRHVKDNIGQDRTDDPTDDLRRYVQCQQGQRHVSVQYVDQTYNRIEMCTTDRTKNRDESIQTKGGSQN